MATNSYIGLLNGNSVTAVYCHNDGYLSGVGRTLKEFYTDVDTITKLIELGSLSCLGEVIGKQVDFNTYNNPIEMMKRDKANEPTQTVAYHRDRGELLEILRCSIDEYARLGQDSYVVYLFDGRWKVYSRESKTFEEY